MKGKDKLSAVSRHMISAFHACDDSRLLYRRFTRPANSCQAPGRSGREPTGIAK